jgi:hypothetical protein
LGKKCYGKPWINLVERSNSIGNAKLPILLSWTLSFKFELWNLTIMKSDHDHDHDHDPNPSTPISYFVRGVYSILNQFDLVDLSELRKIIWNKMASLKMSLFAWRRRIQTLKTTWNGGVFFCPFLCYVRMVAEKRKNGKY